MNIKIKERKETNGNAKKNTTDESFCIRCGRPYPLDYFHKSKNNICQNIQNWLLTKNSFLDCLIDKYNKDPKEEKKSLYYNIWISVLYLKIL